MRCSWDTRGLGQPTRGLLLAAEAWASKSWAIETRLSRRSPHKMDTKMRYLVRARAKPGCEGSLLAAIEHRTLGQGSVAGDEYLRNMAEARICPDGTTRWVEVCYCATPLEEERPYWEQYFELVKVQDAHDRRQCRDQNGSEPWSCNNCDCTTRLEGKLAALGEPFLETLQSSKPIR